nr:hypothetical protein [Candidatus Omnitrophota bacterium]
MAKWLRTKLKENQSFISTLLLLVLAGALFLFFNYTEAFQLKRAIRRTTTGLVGTLNETTTDDLTDGGINPEFIDEPIDITKSFLMFSQSTAGAERRDYTDAFGDSGPDSALFARRSAGVSSGPLSYTLLEFVDGVNATASRTLVGETFWYKNVTLPKSFDLNRTIAVLSWMTWRTSTIRDIGSVYSVGFLADDKIQIRRGYRTNSYINDVAYQILEFDRDVSVRYGCVTIASGQRGTNINLDPAVDLNKTFLLFSSSYGERLTAIGATDGSNEALYAVKGNFTSSSNLNFSRYGNNQMVTIPYFVVEFENNAFVQPKENVAVTAQGADHSFTAVDLNRSFPVRSVKLNVNDSASLDNIMYSACLTSTTTMNLSRTGSDGVSTDISSFIVQLPALDILKPDDVGTLYVGDNDSSTQIQWLIPRGDRTENYTFWLCKGSVAGDCSVANIANYNIFLGNMSGEQTNASNLTFAWNITDMLAGGASNPITEVARVAVADWTTSASMSASTYNWDISNYDFKIRGRLNLTAPAADALVYVGNKLQVNWTKNGNFSGNNFNLSYADDSSNFIPLVAGVTHSLTQADCNCSGYNATQCWYNWSVPLNLSDKFRVRVNTTTNPDRYCSTSGNFSVTDALDLTVNDITAPYGTFSPGEPVNISWTKLGNYTNLNTNFTFSFAPSLTGTYTEIPALTRITEAQANCTQTDCFINWTAPAAKSTDCRIRINVTGLPSQLFNISEPFTIDTFVTLVQPNSGTYYFGQNFEIQWDRGGDFSSSFFDVVLINASDYSVAQTIADDKTQVECNCDGADTACNYTWFVPTIVGDNYKVLVYATTDTSVNSSSANPLTIAGHIYDITPDGGETWYMGQTATVTWKKVGNFTDPAANFTVALSSTGANPYTVLYTNLTALQANCSAEGDNSCYYDDIDVLPWYGSTFKVNVSSIIDPPNLQNTTLGTFNVSASVNITTPTGTTKWYMGNGYYVNWTKNADFRFANTTFSVYLSPEGDGNYNITIAEAKTQAECACSDVDNDCSYFWPAVAPSMVQLDKPRLKVQLDSNPAQVFCLTTRFNITGLITLTAPNGYEQWAPGDSVYVNWTRTGNFTFDDTKFNITLSLDDDETWPVVIGENLTQADVSCENEDINCSYPWVVGDYYSTLALVNVSLTGYPVAIRDISANNFNITSGVNITSPNGGQNWKIGENHTINWTRRGNLGTANFTVTYSNDALEATNISIRDNVNATDANCSGTDDSCFIYWDIPVDYSTFAKVHVYWQTDPLNVSDTSSGFFNLTSSINIVTPTGGESWQAGQARTVSWTKTGDLKYANTTFNLTYYNGTGWRPIAS